MSPSNPFRKLKNYHLWAKTKDTLRHPYPKFRTLVTSPFTRFVFLKFLFYVVVAFFAATIVFFIIVGMPGDPVTAMIASGNGAQGQDINVIRAYLTRWFGLDQPLLNRYGSFLGSFITANFGQSFHYFPVSVGSLVAQFLPYTLMLAIPVLIIGFLAGNWIGARAAYLKGKVNETSYFGLVVANQLPYFWFAMILLFGWSMLFGIAPIGTNSQGITPELSIGYIGDLLYHWFLPFMSLLIVNMGGWATGMRSMVTHERDADYVRYGEQLGFKKGKLMSYAQRNAILPQFTGLNLVFSGIIGNTLIIEIVFGWHGIGYLLLNSINYLDYPVVFGCFYVIILVVIVGNFLIDILYGFLDPRIRTGKG
jgi:peptide/nickel transport system permease protein